MMSLRRGGRLCPPCMTAEPCCRAGPACPAGKHAYRAAGHMGPAVQGGRDKPPVGDGVPGVPSARQRRAARPPLGGGCRRRRLGERNCRAISLPPSALRAATSLAEGGKGKRIPTPVCALARNDRGTGRTESSAPTERNKSRTKTGRRTPRAFVPLRSTAGRRPLRAVQRTCPVGRLALRPPFIPAGVSSRAAEQSIPPVKRT